MSLRCLAGALALTLLGATAGSNGAEAQNLLLADPDFDDGIGAWMVGAGQVSNAGSDADGCPQSFAFHGETTGSGSPSIVRATGSECHTVQMGDTFELEVRYRSERPVHLHLILYAGGGCTTPFIGELGDPFAATVDWTTARRTISVTPDNATGARFSVLAMDDPGPSSFAAEFDRAYLGRVPRIFSDDFEGGATCRWSGAIVQN